MRTSGLLMRVSLIAGLAAAAGPGFAQVMETVVSDQHGDGALWFQAPAARRSVGSAQLADLDTGEPPAGLGMQAIWLEWTTGNVFVSGVGGGLLTAEVLTPAPGAAPMAGLLGAATLNGGFVLTFDTGTLTDVRPCVGSFLWTSDRLYLAAVGGGIARAEVRAPGGDSIAGVQGVALIASGLFDLDPDPVKVEPHILGSALVYTPAALYHVAVDLSGGVSFATTELSQPPSSGGGSIGNTLGAAVVSSGFAFAPPPVPLGSAFVWNEDHVFLVTKAPAGVSVAVVPMVPDGNVWGVMPVAQGGSPFRGGALIWHSDHVYLATLLPALVVTEVTTPAMASIASGVTVPGERSAAQRQSSFLYEVRARLQETLGLRPGHVIGLNQRSP